MVTLLGPHTRSVSSGGSEFVGVLIPDLGVPRGNTQNQLIGVINRLLGHLWDP